MNILVANLFLLFILFILLLWPSISLIGQMRCSKIHAELLKHCGYSSQTMDWIGFIYFINIASEINQISIRRHFIYAFSIRSLRHRIGLLTDKRYNIRCLLDSNSLVFASAPHADANDRGFFDKRLFVDYKKTDSAIELTNILRTINANGTV